MTYVFHLEEILSVEKYVSGYACKGNQPTGAVVDLFNDLVNCADESTGATAKSICTNLLMQAVKFLVAKSHYFPLPMQVSLLFLFPVMIQCQIPFYKLSLY
jgi:hypothetical protein